MAQGDIWLYKLKPISLFHLGEKGAEKEAVREIEHSDSLFGAICWGLLELEGEDRLKEFLSLFKEKERVPFLLSSAFPFVKEKLLLPRPLGFGKKAKGKIEIPVGNFEFYEVLPSQIRVFRMPRAMVHREGGNPLPFPFGVLDFAGESGLWFLVKFLDEGVKKIFDAVLRLLGEEGIGGGRSCGFGRFELVETKPLKLPETEEGYLASLFYPEEDEINALTSYDYIPRYSWISAPGWMSYRAKPVRMIKEGSIVKPLRPIMGKMVTVTPGGGNYRGPEILRYGYAFLLPVRRERDEAGN